MDETQKVSLPAFLNARLDEREAGAREVLTGNARACANGLHSTLWDEEDWDARMELREVGAGRNILARYADILGRMEDDDYPAGVARDQAREYEDFVLPNLAAVYSDHPGYRQEWKP